MKDDLIGTLIAGTFRIERVLGRGGMGVVYAASHEKLRELVAIKLLQIAAQDGDGTEIVDDEMSETLKARFLREARISARFRNEHMARVSDVGTLEDGTPYIVMEYIDGVSLRSFLGTGRLAPNEAVEIVTQVCEALAEAHAQQVVHRDLKPSNLFITVRADGTRLVKILDFGISKTTEDTGRTCHAELLGSPRYMAPEQLHDASSVDVRADVWSLGVILAECLTGRRLFDGENVPEIVASVLASAPRVNVDGFPPDVDPALINVVHAALVHDPDARLQSVAELANGMLAAIGAPDANTRVNRITHALGGVGAPIRRHTGGDSTCPTPSPVARTTVFGKKKSTRRPLVLGGAALGAALLIGAIVLRARAPSTGEAATATSDPKPATDLTPAKSSSPETPSPSPSATSSADAVPSASVSASPTEPVEPEPVVAPRPKVVFRPPAAVHTSPGTEVPVTPPPNVTASATANVPPRSDPYGERQ